MLDCMFANYEGQLHFTLPFSQQLRKEKENLESKKSNKEAKLI